MPTTPDTPHQYQRGDLVRTSHHRGIVVEVLPADDEHPERARCQWLDGQLPKDYTPPTAYLDLIHSVRALRTRAHFEDAAVVQQIDQLRRRAADLAAALADAVGFTPPRAAVGSELVDYVGHQFRVLTYSLSDGKDVWSEWRTIDAVDGSPFGNSVAVKWHVRTADVDCVTVVPGSSEVAETDAVQVRVRLHADDDATKAVA